MCFFYKRHNFLTAVQVRITAQAGTLQNKKQNYAYGLEKLGREIEMLSHKFSYYQQYMVEWKYMKSTYVCKVILGHNF